MFNNFEWRDALDCLVWVLGKNSDLVVFDEATVFRVALRNSDGSISSKDAHMVTFPMTLPWCGECVIAVGTDNTLYIGLCDGYGIKSYLDPLPQEHWMRYMRETTWNNRNAANVAISLLQQIGERTRKYEARTDQEKYDSVTNDERVRKGIFERAVDAFVQQFYEHSLLDGIWIGYTTLSAHTASGMHRSPSPQPAIKYQDVRTGEMFTVSQAGGCTYVGISMNDDAPHSHEVISQRDVEDYFDRIITDDNCLAIRMFKRVSGYGRNLFDCIMEDDEGLLRLYFEQCEKTGTVHDTDLSRYFSPCHTRRNSRPSDCCSKLICVNGREFVVAVDKYTLDASIYLLESYGGRKYSSSACTTQIYRKDFLNYLDTYRRQNPGTLLHFEDRIRTHDKADRDFDPRIDRSAFGLYKGMPDQNNKNSGLDTIVEMIDDLQKTVDNFERMPISIFRSILGALRCILTSKTTEANVKTLERSLVALYDSVMRKVDPLTRLEAKEVLDSIGTVFPRCQVNEQIRAKLQRKYCKVESNPLVLTMLTLCDLTASFTQDRAESSSLDTTIQYLANLDVLLASVAEIMSTPNYRTVFELVVMNMRELVVTMPIETDRDFDKVDDWQKFIQFKPLLRAVRYRLRDYADEHGDKNIRKFRRAKPEAETAAETVAQKIADLPTIPLDQDSQKDEENATSEPTKFVTMVEALKEVSSRNPKDISILDTIRALDLKELRNKKHYTAKYLRDKGITSAAQWAELSEPDAVYLLGRSKYYAKMKQAFYNRGILWPSA